MVAPSERARVSSYEYRTSDFTACRSLIRYVHYPVSLSSIRDNVVASTRLPRGRSGCVGVCLGLPLAEDHAAVPLLELRNIRKSFGAIEALRDVSFSVDRGEVVALLGDNGAGKSTLVKMISGGLAPSSGDIMFDGSPCVFTSPLDAKKAGIETVYQDLSLCTNVDVVANFFMGREITKKIFGVPILDEAEMTRQTEEALRRAGTKIPSLKVKVEHLSGGQRQAIELNRFVHFGGKLVLLDEPFAALGVEQTRRGLEMIRRVSAEGIGVIVITHIMQQAFMVADRIVVLRQGIVAGDVPTSRTTESEVVSMITGEVEPRAGGPNGLAAQDARH
jgi:D-xylose transport system ATP-binding protein